MRGCGDFDGDNTPDLAYGAPAYSGGTGRVQIVFGDGNPSSTGDRYVNGETGDDRFGWSVEVSGDTIVVGARLEDSNTTGIDGDQSDHPLQWVKHLWQALVVFGSDAV